MASMWVPKVIASRGLIFLNGSGAHPGTIGSMGRTGLKDKKETKMEGKG